MTDNSSMAPLRIPVFRRLWIALIIFSLGHLIQVVATSWLMLELTGSPLWVSAAIGAPTLPMLVLSLPAGAAADLFDRRTILLLSSMVLAVAAVAMSALSAVDGLTPGRLVGLGLLIGVGISFFNPAWQSLVPSLVPAGLVPGAVSLNSASGGVATALGPAVGGLLLATVGPGPSFVVAAVGYLAVVGAIATASTDDIAQEKGSLVVAIATGIRYLRFSRDYLALLLLGSLFGFTSASLRAMLPNLTSEQLGGDSALYGVLLGLFGSGAIVGGITRARASRRIGPHMLSVTILTFGLLGIGVALSTWLPASIVLVTLSGVTWTWILSTLNSTYQVLTPDWVRGRTMGAFVLSIFGFAPLGSLAAGALGSNIGADSALLLFSVGVAAIGILSVRMPFPVLEDIRPPVVRAPDLTQLPRVDHDGEPVLVTSTWRVEPEDVDDFMAGLAELRRVRLRTGATNWAAYRDTADSRLISEVFQVTDWDQRVQQVQRYDTDAVTTIERMDDLATSVVFGRQNLIRLDIWDDPRPEKSDE